MARVIRFVPLVSFSLACVAVSTTAAAEQKLPMLRVRKDSANIRTRPAGSSPVVTTAVRGTILETLDQENNWYWVILPRDVHGTRIPGWVHASDLEVVGEGEPDAVLNHFTEAIEAARQHEIEDAARERERKEQMEAQEQARAEQKDARARAREEQKEAQVKERETREKAREDALLARARQRLEQARRELEAAQKSADQPGAEPAQTAPDQPAVQGQPANPKPSKRQPPKG